MVFTFFPVDATGAIMSELERHLYLGFGMFAYVCYIYHTFIHISWIVVLHSRSTVVIVHATTLTTSSYASEHLRILPARMSCSIRPLETACLAKLWPRLCVRTGMSCQLFRSASFIGSKCGPPVQTCLRRSAPAVEFLERLF